jgi:hypothetical protein
LHSGGDHPHRNRRRQRPSQHIHAPRKVRNGECRPRQRSRTGRPDRRQNTRGSSCDGPGHIDESCLCLRAVCDPIRALPHVRRLSRNPCDVVAMREIQHSGAGGSDAVFRNQEGVSAEEGPRWARLKSRVARGDIPSSIARTPRSTCRLEPTIRDAHRTAVPESARTA